MSKPEFLLMLMKKMGFYQLPKAEAFAIIGTLMHFYCTYNGLPEILFGTHLMCAINDVNEMRGE